MSITKIYIILTTILFSLSMLTWVINALILPLFTSRKTDEFRWKDNKDIQVRVLTINNEETVRKTVKAASDHFSDIKVIAEEELNEIPCDVHVVPDDFEANAIRKGRALEWARINLDYDGEYILYIDEDTVIKDFNGIPDYDIVQFREKPIYTGSIITYLTEVYRMGYQYEQLSFGFYKYPIYAWGGGIAIRQSVEQKVTWDVESITEDTSFAWRAAEINDGISFTVVNEEFYNQSPPSIMALLKQRRRWASGTIKDSWILSPKYKYFVYARLFTWIYSPFVFFNGLLIYLYPDPIYNTLLFTVTLFIQILLIHLTTIIGVIIHHSKSWLVLLSIPVTILLSLLNGIGALWGVVQPATDFKVTEKNENVNIVEE